MDVLNGIRITATENHVVTIEATDLKSSVRISTDKPIVSEPGQVVLNASLLGNLLRKITTQTFTLEVKDSRGTLTAGKNKSRLAAISADGFPNLPLSDGAEHICSIMAGDLARLISEGGSAASAPSDFPKYMGTCLLKTLGDSMIAVSTDGKRLARSKRHCVVHKEEELVLPAPELKNLGKVFSGIDYVRILADGSTVWFILEEGKDEYKRDAAQFSIRRIETTFPKYERILNDERKTVMRIDKSELVPALERIDVISKNNAAHLVALYLKQGDTLRITARAPELGIGSEVVAANIEGEDMTVGYNNAYFIDGLKVIVTDDVRIEFSGDEGQTRIYKGEGDDFLYMLMPVRLMPQDIVGEDDNADFITVDDNSDLEPEDTNDADEYDGENGEAGEGGDFDADSVPPEDEAPF